MADVKKKKKKGFTDYQPKGVTSKPDFFKYVPDAHQVSAWLKDVTARDRAPAKRDGAATKSKIKGSKMGLTEAGRERAARIKKKRQEDRIKRQREIQKTRTGSQTPARVKKTLSDAGWSQPEASRRAQASRAKKKPGFTRTRDIKDIPVAKSSAEKPMSFKETFKASKGEKTFKWTSPRTGKTVTYSTLTADDKAAGKTKWDASSKEWVAPKKATPKK